MSANTNTNIVPFTDAISPKMAKAIKAIETGTIPPEAISEHPGAGGKKFKYVKHTHATVLMNDAFQSAWDWEVRSYEVFTDGSALAIGRLTLHLPYEENGEMKIHKRRIQEVGNFKPINGGMSSAASVSSASSRALLKCMFRAFGFGKELYPDTDEVTTPTGAWNLLLAQAKKMKIPNGKVLLEIFVKRGLVPAGEITEEGQLIFINKFEDLWKAIYEYSEEEKGKRQAIPTVAPKVDDAKEEKV